MKSRDIIISKFDWPAIRKKMTFPFFVIYADPKDYPGKFVGRLFDIDRATRFIFVADSYAELLDGLPLAQMTKVGRNPQDDPCIVEVWI